MDLTSYLGFFGVGLVCVWLLWMKRRKWLMGFLVLTAVEAWLYTSEIAEAAPHIRALFSICKYAIAVVVVWVTVGRKESDES